MSLAQNVLRGGFSAGQAKNLEGAIATGLTAAGTTLATALDLLADICVIGTCASGAGVQLASCELGDSQVVYNGGANACAVYPDVSTAQINNIAVGGAHLLATNTACKYYKISATRWIAILSA